ncbi:MAG: glycosyltransferase [Elusimicrobia bacterium]|nr:glycosyltransferase [Elusimicrobiota bacterium]
MPRPDDEPELTLVVPTFEERENIAELLAGAAGALAGRRWEIVVVDDASTDGTADAAAAFADTRVSVLTRRAPARDLAGSVALGFSRARGRILASMNADGSHDPADLPRLLAAIDAGAEVAIGSRYAPGGRVGAWPWRRRALSAAGTAAARTLLGLRVSDPLSGFYAVTRPVFERARRLEGARGFKVLLELLVRGRPARVVEIPIAFQDRRRGRSKMTARAAWQAWAGLWRLRGAA